MFLALSLVLWIGEAHGQTPAPTPPNPVPALAITGQTTVAAYNEVILSLTGGTANCAWLVIPDASEWSSGQTLVFTGAPGTYTAICLAVSGTSPIILKTTVTITPAPGPTPPPGPTPTPPGPTPPPPPSNPPYAALAIFDTSQQQNLPIGQLGIWISNTLASELKSSTGVYLKRLDVNNLDSPDWKKALSGLTLPALIVVDKSWKAISAGPLPPDVDSVLATVKKLGKSS